MGVGSLVGLVDGAEEVLKVVCLILQEIDFLGALLVLRELLLLDLLFQSVLFLLQFLGPFLQHPLFLFQFDDARTQLRSPLFGLQLLPHGESERAFVQCFVGVDRHVEFVPDSHQEDAPFRAVDSHLANDFVVALFMEFLANGADP